MLKTRSSMHCWRASMGRLARYAVAMCALCLALAASRALAQSYGLTPFKGDVPAGAIEAGNAGDGSPIYVCVVASWGGEHPGALRVDGRCEVPWGGQVHQFDDDFEVLIGGAAGAANWVRMGKGGVPDHAFAAGDDGGPLYVCRAAAGGGLYPGKLGEDGWCYLAAEGRELTLTEDYEVLVD